MILIFRTNQNVFYFKKMFKIQKEDPSYFITQKIVLSFIVEISSLIYTVKKHFLKLKMSILLLLLEYSSNRFSNRK